MIPERYPKLRHTPKSFIYINLDGSILHMGFPERRLTQPGFLQLGQFLKGEWQLRVIWLHSQQLGKNKIFIPK